MRQQHIYLLILFIPDRFTFSMKTFSNDIFFTQVESEIEAGRSVRLKVKGNSMYPLLRNGIDEVTLSPLCKEPAKMDIILFKYKGKHILHRIINIKDGVYTIQGDGIYASYETCVKEDIIGVVTAIHKHSSAILDPYSKSIKISCLLWFKIRFIRRWILAVLRRIR